MVPADNPLERRIIETRRNFSSNGRAQADPANASHSHFRATKEELQESENGPTVPMPQIACSATRRYVEGSARRMASATNAKLAPGGSGTVAT